MKTEGCETFSFLHVWLKPKSGWHTKCDGCGQDGFMIPTSEGIVVVPVDVGEEEDER